MFPKEVKDFIGSDEIESHKKYFWYEEEPLDKNREIIVKSYLDIIKPYYEKFGRHISPGMFNFLIEPIKNSNYYSLKESGKRGVFELFLSPKKLVAGYFDGGEYFKKKDVKDCWENRILHKERKSVELRKKGIKEIGFGIGTQKIYYIADFIFVDNLEGKLYTGIDFDKNVAFGKRE